jgi:hypothetical protein
MKHAGPVALDALEPLCAALRKHAALTERKRGVFYRRSAAFCHFHEDPAGFFADVRAPDAWRRYPVTTPAERRAFLRDVKTFLAV